MGKGITKKHKALKVILIVLAVMVVLCIGGFFIAATHTQLVVGFLQKIADNGKPLNSFEPLNEPQNCLKENGQYLISEIEYAKVYLMNSMKGCRCEDLSCTSSKGDHCRGA